MFVEADCWLILLDGDPVPWDTLEGGELVDTTPWLARLTHVRTCEYAPVYLHRRTRGRYEQRQVRMEDVTFRRLGADDDA